MTAATCVPRSSERSVWSPLIAEQTSGEVSRGVVTAVTAARKLCSCAAAVRAQQRRQRLKEERDGAHVEGRRVAADGLCPDAEADDVAKRGLEAMSAGR